MDFSINSVRLVKFIDFDILRNSAQHCETFEILLEISFINLVLNGRTRAAKTQKCRLQLGRRGGGVHLQRWP